MPDQEQPKRTTDERVDAIAMNLELLHHVVTEMGIKVTEMGIKVAANATAIEALTGNVNRIVTVVETLAGLVRSHEERLSRLEGPHQR